MEDKKKQRWECAYCGFVIKSSKRPIKCSCHKGYTKYIKLSQ